MALGSDVTLAFVTDAPKHEADQLLDNLWRQIYTFERQFSRFLPMSELSVFNRSAGLELPVTPEFIALLSAAKKMSDKTNGLYNPFILPALQRAGYKQSAAPGYENDVVDDFSDRHVAPAAQLTMSVGLASIPYGTALDMGGCGKGYLADQLREPLGRPDIYGYCLSLGGDIATAGHDEHGEPWVLYIQDANDLSGEADWIIHCPKTPYAVATSGTFRRKNQAKGGDWHHIIDPFTLKPATTDVRLATICAASALEADVYASCAVLLGSQKAPEFLKKQGMQAMLLQCANETDVFEEHFGPSIHKRSAQLPSKGGSYA